MGVCSSLESADVNKTLSSIPDAQFCRRLKFGKLTFEHLPDRLILTGRILQQMDDLWKLMVDDPDNKEQGACILLDSSRNLRLDHVADERSQRHVVPKCRAEEHNDHLGFFHTHWYLAGHEQVGFSDNDFAGVLEDGESLSLVRSGKQVFALLRTTSTRKLRSVSRDELMKFHSVFEHYSNDDHLSQPDAQLRANHDLCKQLGLAFYRGLFGGPLSRDWNNEQGA